MRFLGIFLLLCLPVQADEIRVLSGGAAKSFIDPLAATFPGHTVKIEYQPMGRLTKSLAEGYPADMIVVTAEVLEALKLQGTPLARVGIGVAVHERAPLPDISSAEGFKRTLLAAKSVVYIELGIHQISEILPVKGVKLAGPLPPELQKYTVYVAVPVRNHALANQFIAHLTGPQAANRLAQAGYTSP